MTRLACGKGCGPAPLQPQHTTAYIMLIKFPFPIRQVDDNAVAIDMGATGQVVSSNFLCQEWVQSIPEGKFHECVDHFVGEVVKAAIQISPRSNC